MKHKNFPHLEHESIYWDISAHVAGVDEVGRGALAGPVVAGIVVLDPDKRDTMLALHESGIIIHDSKKLNAAQREIAAIWIQNNALAWGIGNASVSEINTLGIVKAVQAAVRRAYAAVLLKTPNITVEHLLSDAFFIPRLKGLPKNRQTPIIKGDNISLSIAAASIIAKVYRDAHMVDLGLQYSQYHWEQNKGYGTKAHKQALVYFGPCKHHRRLFIRKLL